MLIHQLLKHCIENHISDLHIASNRSPYGRKCGEIFPIENFPISEDYEEELLSMLSDNQKSNFEQHLEYDDSYYVPDLGRFRFSLFKQQNGGLSAVFRIQKLAIPTLEEIKLPQVAYQFCDYHQGLVLITGPANSGKTTTLSAMVQYMNQNKNLHILTMEDPIEYIHPNIQSIINQRQIGAHTNDFSTALKAALREDPDVIVVGEMRDLETFSMALTAAETGHLVLGTMHTKNATSTINRIIDVFPADDQEQIRAMVSESIKGVISQVLVPDIHHENLIAAYEIMMNVPSIANMIRDHKTFQIPSLIQMNRKKYGMMLLEDSLTELKNQGKISDLTYSEWVYEIQKENE